MFKNALLHKIYFIASALLFFATSYIMFKDSHLGLAALMFVASWIDFKATRKTSQDFDFKQALAALGINAGAASAALIIAVRQNNLIYIIIWTVLTVFYLGLLVNYFVKNKV